MAEDGRKRFRDRRAAARVNNGTTSFREARRRWTGTRVHARACMREVLIGSVRGWGAQKQPSGQTSQHQSAPVTRARTIGANIAILPAFTFDGEKDNDRTDGIALAGIGDSKLPWKRSPCRSGSLIMHRDSSNYTHAHVWRRKVSVAKKIPSKRIIARDRIVSKLRSAISSLRARM